MALIKSTTEDALITQLLSAAVCERSGVGVERIDQLLFYRLASALNGLRGLKTSDESVPIYLGLNAARGALRSVLASSATQLRYSRPAADDVLADITTCISQYFQSKDSDGKVGLKIPDKVPNHAFHFGSVIQTLETNLAAEFREAPTYYVSKRGAYDTADLVDHAERMLEENLHGTMGEKTVSEYKAAGRCYAFGLPTATGFHVCRAVEAMLENYYKVCSGEDKTLKSWHDYIVALTKIEKSNNNPQRPQSRTLHDLGRMKNSSRNPIMHPRVVLNEVDADILLSEGKNIITLMAIEVNDTE